MFSPTFKNCLYLVANQIKLTNLMDVEDVQDLDKLVDLKFCTELSEKVSNDFN